MTVEGREVSERRMSGDWLKGERRWAEVWAELVQEMRVVVLWDQRHKALPPKGQHSTEQSALIRAGLSGGITQTVSYLFICMFVCFSSVYNCKRHCRITDVDVSFPFD